MPAAAECLSRNCGQLKCDGPPTRTLDDLHRALNGRLTIVAVLLDLVTLILHRSWLHGVGRHETPFLERLGSSGRIPSAGITIRSYWPPGGFNVE